MEDKLSESRRLLDGEIPQCTLKYKIVKTINLCCLWISFGCYSEIVGPTMPELIHQMRSSYTIISQAIAMRGAGHALGGLIGGLLGDKLRRHSDLFIAACMIGYTGVSVGSAYVLHNEVLYILYLIQGALETAVNIVGQRVAVHMWKEKAAGPIHFLQLGYGLGSIAVPQLVKPFLDPSLSGAASSVSSYQSSCFNQSTTTTSPPDNVTEDYHSTTTLNNSTTSRFHTAYLIIAALSVYTIVAFLVYYFIAMCKPISVTDSLEDHAEPKSFRDTLRLSSCAPGHPKFAAVILFCGFLFFITCIPINRVFSKFIYSYARDGPCLSVSESTDIQTVFWTAISIGRFITFVVSHFIHMKFLLMVECFGSLACLLVLYFLHNNITILWVFSGILGLFTGPMSPSLFAWTNRYIELTAAAQMMPNIGAAVGDVITMFSIGYSYDHYGPYVLWSYQLGIAAVLLATAVFMQIVASFHGDRFTRAKTSSSQNDK